MSGPTSYAKKLASEGARSHSNDLGDCIRDKSHAFDLRGFRDITVSAHNAERVLGKI